MSVSRAELIERIFQEAAETPLEQRDDFLQEKCGSDAELLKEVRQLLRHHEAAPSAFLAGRDSDQECDAAEMLVGRQVHQFLITRVIAAGGMGIVYEAQQQRPQRRVALKVLRSSLASESAWRRFAHEPEILARLHHPAIAQIYETGVHEEGALRVPYFAMEYVPGALSLTAYAAKHAMNERRRLVLFLQACDAVQYGHQHGIVHRDLKPGNILIDDSGAVKVIDFGVARATDADIAISTMQTEAGQILGTLQYMSPEQCTGGAADIDARSDVYALGVVLYELLTDKLPYDLSMRTPFEIPGVIREQMPRRPSSFKPGMRGDLDVILLKALEKEKERRYQSVATLAQDVQRYLAGEPIQARRGSGLYVLRKTLYRHRTAATLTLVAFLALLGFSISMTLLYARAKSESDTSREIVQILQDVFTQADPYHSSNDPSLRGLLDATSVRLSSGAIKKPLVRAAVQRTLGAAYLDLGVSESADNHIRAALDTIQGARGDDHPETAICKSLLSVQLVVTGQAENAIKYLDEALPVLERHADAYPADLTQCYGRYAHALLTLGRYEKAETYARRYVARTRLKSAGEYPDTASALALLAYILQERGQFEEAERVQREALELDRAKYGAEHIRSARDAGNLAIILKNRGHLEEAETLQREALAVYERLYPEDASIIATAAERLANIMVLKGDREAAQPIFRKAIKSYEAAYGVDHPWVADACMNLSNCLVFDGYFDEASELARRAVEVGKKSLPAEHPRLALFQAMYGRCLLEAGRYQEAEAPAMAGYEGLNKAFGFEDGRTQQALQGLLDLYQRWEKPDLLAQYQALRDSTPAATSLSDD